ncbi:MAG: NAD-dependent succinate-semialdehyde dehydrogenase [Rhizobiaceae bacterium]|nr:NAD-dependent succinate-semialdehyde dehydrogenase [Rhizobiaceae bacterium]
MPDTKLFLCGKWRDASDGRRFDVLNPATGEVIGTCAHAGRDDIEAALASAERGFQVWRATTVNVRYDLLRKAAALLRERLEATARTLTLEQGKPIGEARLEIALSADILDWCAEEVRRAYGRIIPSRFAGVSQQVLREPVGPVAAFTPWNFPVSQAARKLGPAIATGCSVIVKAAEDTPAAPAALVAALVDAGLPEGVLSLLYGDPAEISGALIPSPVIRKVSFTGSVAVGKQLAGLAGSYMKRTTMELGGHAPAIVFADADLDRAGELLVRAKYRNAGQVCVSPTRFLVEESVYEGFVERFAQAARAIRVGQGVDEATAMGPLVSRRRQQAVEDLVADAQRTGAGVIAGGNRIGNQGNFFEPTVLDRVPLEARAMNEEPFGPVALFRPFRKVEDVLDEANRLPYGLATYLFTRSASNVAALSTGIDTGMLTINHLGLGQAETPFGGVKDSGYGSEGGTEILEPYLTTRFVTHMAQA